MKRLLICLAILSSIIGFCCGQNEGIVHEGAPTSAPTFARPPTPGAATAQQQGVPVGQASDSIQTGQTVVGASMNYVLRTGDLLRVEIFQEHTLTKETRIAGDGTIVLPLIGSVKIGGFTVGDATRLLRELYAKDYLVNPELTLLILQYGSRLVYIHGQVNRGSTPVQMPPEGGMTLTEAIGMAGGISLRADSNVVIQRKHKDGTTERITVNFKRILRSEKAPDVILQEGDIVFVDEAIF